MSETKSDSIPKTMLILKSQTMGLGAVEAFLRNRGWKLYSTTNLKEALIQIVSQKPSYVLVSIDHPNKKVRALPKLLTTAFPAATIVFAETQSSSSYKILNESATEYRVYPPVTGPAIERCVNKYIRDVQTKASVEANDIFRSENKWSNDTISIKGGGNDNVSPTENNSEFGGDNVNRLLSQFLGEDMGSLTSSTVAKVDNNLVFAQPLEDDDDISNAHFNPSEKTDNDDQNNLLPSYLPTKPDNTDQQSGTSGFGRTYVQKGSTGDIGTYVPSSDNNTPGPSIHELHARSDANDTLIARGAQKSLQDSTEVHDGTVKDKLEETKSAACIVVDSPRFSGYLVVVMGKNRKIDRVFIDSIKVKLFTFLKENGEAVTESDSMDIKIKQVDFEPWALEYADFLRKSVHQGSEVAMAFFPHPSIKAILEESQDNDMAMIQLSELHGDRDVEFDLYIYLPNNNRYVLFTPKDGVLYHKQMDRLKEQGVTHLHVQKDAVTAITKYRAENYLNGMVDDHEQKIVGKSKAAS